MMKKEASTTNKRLSQNVEKPRLEGKVFRAEEPDDELWIKEFRAKYPRSIEIDDDLSVKFDRDQCDKSCEIFIRNTSRKPFHLKSIEVDLPSVTLRGGSCAAEIQPRERILVILDVAYVPDRHANVARVDFHFGGGFLKNFGTVRRSIDICYRDKGPTIQRSLYDAPDDLIDLIHKRKKSQSELLDSLDARIPTTSQNYAEHFHSLLYLEEIGLSKTFTDIYNHGKAHFGDINCFKRNGKGIREKYERGIFDLTVNNLFETRPSLQVGDRLTARKNSEPDISYEGVIIDVKEVDLIVVKFGDSFIGTFDHTAYSVEFSFSRSYMIRQHFAIDLSVELFGMAILTPNEISLRDKPLVDAKSMRNLAWFNGRLNMQQTEAVQQIIRGDLLNPYLIFGPPGTGKTTTLVEIILQLLKVNRDFKILITTQSNSAANLITQRLIQSGQVELGSFLRLTSHNYSIRSDVIPKDIEEYSKTIDKLMDEEKETNFFRGLELVKRYRVVVGTFAAVSKLLESSSLRNYFTHSIIDEAGQCTETDVLVPMVLVGKIGQTIMAGDPMQMTPLVINRHANARGLAASMLGRLIQCYSNMNNDDAGHKKFFGSRLISKLLQNYRSLPSILNYTNKQFYNSELIATIDAENSSEAKLLKHLDAVFPDIKNPGEYGIHFVNIELGHNEKRETSWFNIAEVKAIKTLVNRLKQLGLPNCDIGIISPYFLQTKALKRSQEKNPDIKIGTVEDFQGLERKVILISTVRTCSATAVIDVNRHLGFVKCPNRTNVATSRARSMVVVVGKAVLLSKDEHWSALITECKNHNTYRQSIMD